MKRFIVVLLVLFICAGAAWAVDSDKKVKLLEAAVEGDTNAQFELARIYEGESREDDILKRDMELLKKAVHWYEKAAKKGHRQSQRKLLVIYRFPYNEIVPAEWPAKWLPLAKRMAAEGDKVGRYELAEYYSFPHNCDTRFRECLNEAIGLYSEILKSMDPGEETVLSFFEFGQKITRQEIEEKISYLTAIDPEDKEKRSRLEGHLYSARKSGSSKDLVDLGDRWADPSSPDHHIEMAQKAYQYAAEKNHPEAQLKLANLLYQQAKDVRDYANAYFWAKAAVLNGNKGASELLTKAKEKLPAEHLPAIEAEAKEGFKYLEEQNKKKAGAGEQ